jgi:urea transport system permease protein
MTLKLKNTPIGAALLLAAAAAPFVLAPYQLNLLGRFLALSLTAMGLVILWGRGGVLSLGQGVFFGLGAYSIAMHLKLASLSGGDTMPDFMIWTGVKSLPAWWGIFAHPAVAIMGVVLVPTLAALGFAWLMFRRRIDGVYFALITQALGLAFATLLISQQAFTGGFNGLTDFQTLFGARLSSPPAQKAVYWATLVIVAATLVAGRWLLATRYGKMLLATRDGANRVRFLGYDPAPYKMIAFVLAAALAGLSGALFTLHAGVISPALVGVVPSIEMVVWAAIGGRTSLAGAIVGALVVNYAKDQISTVLPTFWLYVLGALFILAVTVAPKGLAGLFPAKSGEAA